MLIARNGLASLAALLFAATLQAQSTTGTISGTCHRSARVSRSLARRSPLTSPALQGSRTTVTAENGDYVVPLLPPGTYTVTFELSGFETQEKTVTLAPTQTLPRGRRARPGRRSPRP